MTQKSYARKQRDAKKKAVEKHLANNTCWDELNEIYVSMCTLLAQHGSLSQLAADKVLIEAVEDKTTLVTNIRILANDLRTLNTELTHIHDLHKDKTGGSDDPDIVITTINIFEQYNLFMERHQAVVMPIVYHITEQFAQAEKKLNDISKAERDLVDPNVISDAIIVDPKDTIVIDKADDKDMCVVVTPFGEVITPVNVPAPDFDKLSKSFKEIHGKE